MLTNIMKYFEKLDIIGPEIGLEHNNSNSYKSLLGAIISLIAYIACTVIAFMFGREIYQRKNPNIFVTNQMLSNSDIPIESLKLLFSLYDLDGSKVQNVFDYVSIGVTYFTVPIDGYPKLETDDYDINVTYEGDNKDQIIIGLNVPENSTISNDLYSSNSTTLIVSVYKCDTRKRICAEDLEKALSTKLFVVAHASSYFDLTNYSYPVNEVYLSKAIPLSDQLTKNVQVEFSKNYLVSDNGWILENIVTYYSNQLTRYDFQYNLIEKKKHPESELVMIQFCAPRLISKTTRNYMKVQQLFALIGGLVTAITLSSKIIFYHYLRFSYLSYFYSIENQDSKLPVDLNLIISNKTRLNIPRDNLSAVNIISTNLLNNTKPNLKISQNNNASIGTLVKFLPQIEKISKSAKMSNKGLNSENNLNIKEANNSRIILNNKNIENESNNNSKIIKDANNISNFKVNKEEDLFRLERNNSENIKGNNVEIINKNPDYVQNSDFELKLNDLSYISYIFSFLCCRMAEIKVYKKYLDSLENILDIKTYKFLLKNVTNTNE